MKKNNDVVKPGVVDGKVVLESLDGVIESLSEISRGLSGDGLSYLRIAIDNAVSVALQYRHDLEVFFDV